MQIYILLSLAVPKILLGVRNAVIDSVSMRKSAITQVDSPVLFFTDGITNPADRRALVSAEPEQAFS